MNVGQRVTENDSALVRVSHLLVTSSTGGVHRHFCTLATTDAF